MTLYHGDVVHCEARLGQQFPNGHRRRFGHQARGGPHIDLGDEFDFYLWFRTELSRLLFRCDEKRRHSVRWMSLRGAGHAGIQFIHCSQIVHRHLPYTGVVVKASDHLPLSIENLQGQDETVQEATVLRFKVLLVAADCNLVDLFSIELVLSGRAARAFEHRPSSRRIEGEVIPYVAYHRSSLVASTLGKHSNA